MKYASVLSALLLLVAGCASTTSMTSSSGSRPEPEIHIAQINSNPDLYYFSGPINIQYALEVTNPTNDTYKLKRINLQTEGPGAYYLRTGNSPLNYTVPPGTSAVKLSLWGRANGGFLRATEPVSLRGTAYFDGPQGPFVKVFTEIVTPQ